MLSLGLTAKEIEYLIARDLTSTDTASTIVRGFLKVDIEGLPPLLNTKIQPAMETSENDLMQLVGQWL